MNLCNICGASQDSFTRFSDGGVKIRCSNCLSFERHRRFQWAYELFIRKEFEFKGKEILACVPSKYELEILFKEAKKVTSFDIRPVEWFDMQLDITNMSAIPNDSYDAFVAIAVMQHVKNDYLVMDEVYRVLRPGGRCFFQASNISGSSTQIYKNLHEHYSVEEYEKYQVGTYRIYNDLEFIEMFQDKFIVKTFHGIDPVCGGSDFILCGYKK
jgi:ubiquinone/menaquinone biosynthesis C-methylase UbiE